jgi:beta-carotene 3-hydroxylase
MVYNLLLLLAAYSFMEFVAWLSHKYIMHGFLWSLHKDHHNESATRSSFFEKNDFFFLIYALPACVLLILGFSLKIYPFVFIGIGITLYGFTYFLVHDLMYHKRLSFIKTPRNAYFAAVMKAHTAHHNPKSKNDFKNFGLLVFQARFLALKPHNE